MRLVLGVFSAISPWNAFVSLPQTSPQAWTPAVISSHDNSPLKSNAKTSGCPDSDLDTSSLSSDGENEAPPQPMKRSGHNIKFTKRKVQHMELAYKQVRSVGCSSVTDLLR